MTTDATRPRRIRKLIRDELSEGVMTCDICKHFHESVTVRADDGRADCEKCGCELFTFQGGLP